MTHLKSAWELLLGNRRAYIVLNAVYYGLVLIFMVVAAFNRPLQDSLINTVGEAFMTGPLSAVGSAYVNAQVFTAIALTFLVNLIIASFLYITIPSLIIPFIGILMGIYRAILWGLIFSPAHPDMQMIMIPHSITLILEGQAYVLAMFGAYLQGSAFLFPRTVGLERRGQGYREGLKRTWKIYILIVLTLLVAAIYEVIEVVIMVKFFS
jgi:hypothetical protein